MLMSSVFHAMYSYKLLHSERFLTILPIRTNIKFAPSHVLKNQNTKF
jgi:hypothetical protein